MQNQIMSQADTIRELNREISRLENENRMQAERIAGLEAVLYAAGILDKDAVLATDSDKAWFADQVLERYEGTSSVSCADTFPVRGEGMRDVEGDDTSSALRAPAELGTSHASRASGSPQGEGKEVQA